MKRWLQSAVPSAIISHRCLCFSGLPAAVHAANSCLIEFGAIHIWNHIIPCVSLSSLQPTFKRTLFRAFFYVKNLKIEFLEENKAILWDKGIFCKSKMWNDFASVGAWARWRGGEREECQCKFANLGFLWSAFCGGGRGRAAQRARPSCQNQCRGFTCKAL